MSANLAKVCPFGRRRIFPSHFILLILSSGNPRGKLQASAAYQFTIASRRSCPQEVELVSKLHSRLLAAKIDFKRDILLNG